MAELASGRGGQEIYEEISNAFQPNLFDLPEVGFEPTLPKRPELKSGALDHSATDAIKHDRVHK